MFPEFDCNNVNGVRDMVCCNVLTYRINNHASTYTAGLAPTGTEVSSSVAWLGVGDATHLAN